MMCLRWSRSQVKGEESHEREKFSTHEMGLRLPHSLDTEVPAQGALPGVPRRDRRDNPRAGGAQDRLRGGRGQRLRRPHTRLPEDTAQVRGVGRHGVPEGQERPDALRQAPRMAQQDREGPHVLGSRLLREHRRAERGYDKEVHQGAGGRRRVRPVRCERGPFRGGRQECAGPSRLAAAGIRDPYRVAQSSHRLCRWL